MYGLVSTTSVEWSILGFIDLSAYKIKTSAKQAEKINKANKEYFIPRS